MILLNAVVEILAVPVADIRTKLASNRTRVTVMPVGGHPGRSDASHRFGRSKELLCRGHIAGLAQHHVHQRASAVNRPVQIAPMAIDFDVGFIDGAPGSWRDPAGESPARVRGSARPVASVASWKVTTAAKRTQQSCGVWD